MASSSAQRSPPTHFLCLPLHGKQYPTLPEPHVSLKSALRQFTEDESEDDSQIPPDAIRPFDTLHLTLGVMTLSPESLTSANKTLESLDLSQFFPSDGDKKLYIDLKGLEPVDTRASAVSRCSVLIIPPTDSSTSSSGRLYAFSNAIRAYFVDKGIITPENRPLRLHATVVNTIYCKRKHQQSKQRGKGGGRIQFDAADVMDRYKDFVWAEGLEVDRVQICKMGAKKGEEVVLEDGTVDVVGGGYEVVAERVI